MGGGLLLFSFTFIPVELVQNGSRDQLENQGLLTERSMKQMFESAFKRGRNCSSPLRKRQERRDDVQLSLSLEYDARLMAAVRGHGHTWGREFGISNWSRRGGGHTERLLVLLAAAEMCYFTLDRPKNIGSNVQMIGAT